MRVETCSSQELAQRCQTVKIGRLGQGLGERFCWIGLFFPLASLLKE